MAETDHPLKRLIALATTESFRARVSGPGSYKPIPLRLLEYDTRLILAYRQMVIHRIVLCLGDVLRRLSATASQPTPGATAHVTG